MKTLENRIAIVTGASWGIGKAIAFAFGREDAKVAVTARTTDALNAVVDHLTKMGTEALAITADLSIESEIGRVSEWAKTYAGYLLSFHGKELNLMFTKKIWTIVLTVILAIEETA